MISNKKEEDHFEDQRRFGENMEGIVKRICRAFKTNIMCLPSPYPLPSAVFLYKTKALLLLRKGEGKSIHDPTNLTYNVGTILMNRALRNAA
jgi:hypothetical protein